MKAFDLDAYVSRSAALDVSDLPWDDIQKYPIPADALRTLRYMQDIETHTIVYLRTLLSTRAMDDAGFSPGITSGFRDDYRQELANGNKAAPDSSYHGGSRRGGYGHGLAADLVSVKGATRAERCTWSEILWKWIDAHEKELGIGRPYLDKDPPHVAPIDGKEYADKRGPAKAQLAGLKRPSLSSKLK